MRRASSDWVQPLSFKAACKRLANSIRIASGGDADDTVPLSGKSRYRLGTCSPHRCNIGQQSRLSNNAGQHPLCRLNGRVADAP
jgi:hypothetical protein